MNIFSETPIKISANYLGSINTEDMKLRGVEVKKVYYGKIPYGKIVAAMVSPYVKLSQEERQKKATGFVIGAGEFFRKRNYGKAATLFEEVLKAQPTPEIYYYLAICYQEMKEEEKALKYLEEGVEKFPKDTNLLKSLGLIYYQTGREDEAKQIFQEVLRLKPEDRQVKFFMERLTTK